ncbi:MAG: hypothetical protein GY789_22215 [Hyphomicrobiales bacterium]|nr:hypothetical protein [Hyphomicrobiales bacterium]
MYDTLPASRAKKERAAASEPARFPGKPDHVDPVASIARTFQAYVIRPGGYVHTDFTIDAPPTKNTPVALMKYAGLVQSVDVELG